MGSRKPYIHMFLFCICSAYILMPPRPGPPLLDRLMRERERNPSISLPGGEHIKEDHC